MPVTSACARTHTCRCTLRSALLVLGVFALATPSLGWCLRRPASRQQQHRGLLSRVRGGAVALPSVAEVSMPPAPVSVLKGPPDNFANAVAMGVKKASAPSGKTFVLGILAGIQVGIGAAMAVATLGGMPGMTSTNPGLGKVISGLVGLPCSLLMVMITGAELFTGNTALMSAAYYEGKVTTGDLARNWFWSYLGNLVGSVFLAALCAYAGVFSSTSASFATVGLAKASLPFGTAIARGVLCNWLVCSALWLGIAASDLISKAASTLMVLTIFVALGFEHSVANMYLLPMGKLLGGSYGVMDMFVKNLLPVTIGNIFAGTVLVSGIQFLAFGKRKINNQ